MKNSKKIIGGIVGIIIIVCIIVAVAINSGMIEKTPSAVKNTVVGEVYGQKITVAQIEDNPQMKTYYNDIAQQVSGNPMDNAQAKQEIVQKRQQIVEQLEVNAIVNEQVKKLNLIPTQADMDKLVAEQKKEFEDGFLKQYGMTEAIYLQMSGMTQEQLNAELEQQARAQAVLSYISKDIKVTDNDAQIYYNENKDTQFTEQPGADTYQIVVSTKAEAEKLKAQYESEISGKNLSVADKLKIFQGIASANNIDSTKQTGGSLGYTAYDNTEYNKNFMNALKELKNNGDVSGIVDSSNASVSAYNVIFVDNVNAEKKVIPFDQVKDKIIETLKSQKVQQQVSLDLDKWKKEAKASVDTNKLAYPILDKIQQNTGAPTEGGTGTTTGQSNQSSEQAPATNNGTTK